MRYHIGKVHLVALLFRIRHIIRLCNRQLENSEVSASV